MKKYSLFALVLASVATPAVSFAANKDVNFVIQKIVGLLNAALGLLIGLAVLIFVWYVIQYFIKPNEDRKNAGLYVMYSLIGFFVILSFWGLVNILQNTFGLKNEDNQPASWTSFKGLFPGGSSSVNTGSYSTNNAQPINSGTYTTTNSAPVNTGTYTTSNSSNRADPGAFGHEYNPDDITGDETLPDARGQEP